jgi:hypothetical protein
MTRDGSEICCVFDMDQEATLIEKLRREGTSALTPEEEAVLYTPRGLARVFPNRLVHLIPVPLSLSPPTCVLRSPRDGGLITAAAAATTITTRPTQQQQDSSSGMGYIKEPCFSSHDPYFICSPYYKGYHRPPARCTIDGAEDELMPCCVSCVCRVCVVSQAAAVPIGGA